VSVAVGQVHYYLLTWTISRVSMTHLVMTSATHCCNRSRNAWSPAYAYYDTLTDIPNRKLLSDRLQQAISIAKRDEKRLAVMFIDLDKFKPINDELGHYVGDLLLKEVTKRMQDCVRESDTVARIGGDEFIVLLPNIEAVQDAMLVAEKIRHSLNQPFMLVGQSLNISSSTGIAVYPEHGKDEIQLVKNADTAMYIAKVGGRNDVRLYRLEKQDG
jgi:diguanylate cyclase (GGDEF)-like protein